MGRDEIGKFSLELIDILESENELVEKEVDLVPFKSKEGKSAEPLGSILFSYKFIPSPCNEGIKGLRAPEVYFEGDLYVNILNARELPTIDKFTKDNPTVSYIITHETKKKYTTPKEKKDLKDLHNPEFNYLEKIPIKVV
jgi:hypothetical protein